MNVESYIEVTGEGVFRETASCYIAEVTARVRAARNETALEEIGEFWMAVVASLRENGISAEEVIEGGIDYLEPWYWRKKPGQTGSRRIIVKVPDFARLNGALVALEPLGLGERRSLTVTLKQPEFESSAEVKSNALSAAFRDAKVKAERLAAQMGCDIGDVLRIEEGPTARRRSGFRGDEDWNGDGDRFGGDGFVTMAAAGGCVGEKDEPTLGDPTRDLWVRCRVRFAIR